jgi:hypothetical protein
MDQNGVFDGFMPSITDIVISRPTASITSSGDLINVHCITIKTLEQEHIYSIQPDDLQKLYFLILKVLVKD